MYPLYRVETEVLIYIFELAVHTPSAIEAAEHVIKPGIASHVSSPFTPLTLSHVCKAWRSLSFSLHELWSTIYVTNGAHGHIPLFQLWLQHSGNHPLKLIFRGTDGITSENGPAILEMVKISTFFSTRWKAFKIKISRGTSGTHLDTVAMAPFFQDLPTPKLESLAFSFSSSSDDTFSKIWKGLAQNSPVLREMQVWATWVRVRPVVSVFPFHRLTTLSLFCIMVDEDEVLLRLDQSTSLETLSISFFYITMGFPQSKMVNLQRLVKLTLVGCSPMIYAMDNLQLPSLSHFSLYIDTPDEEYREEAQSIRISAEKMLTRSNANLKSFTLIDANSQSELIWVSLLAHRSLQSVEELGFVGQGNNAYLDALIIPRSDETVSRPVGDKTANEPQYTLPHLRHIHLVSYEFTDKLHLLSKTVLSRMNALPTVARISSVSANFSKMEELQSERAFWDAEPELEFVDRRFQPLRASPLPEPVINDFSMLEDCR
ncbi:hypothetical protein EST38_g9325 [Candolleomyces aberdarensis]|uniref:F-box domain-containing protein n=1 Tax=Candolleomyces aberdarensis TaxID=2316362 RepID=A0A4Q2DD57_9AGAR|nr:hypothetical protein EST38_g9325 [Candolleomyces aberdarensis]